MLPHRFLIIGLAVVGFAGCASAPRAGTGVAAPPPDASALLGTWVYQVEGSRFLDGGMLTLVQTERGLGGRLVEQPSPAATAQAAARRERAEPVSLLIEEARYEDGRLTFLASTPPEAAAAFRLRVTVVVGQGGFRGRVTLEGLLNDVTYAELADIRAEHVRRPGGAQQARRLY